jgi:predicted nucleic acid-binding protein
MNVLVDTSALLAMLHLQDRNHPAADAIWRRLLEQNATIWSTNYVVVESVSLLQARYGLHVVQTFQASMLPILRIIWIEADMHELAMRSLLLNNRRSLSFVDCSSMAVARTNGIQHIFAFDHHFDEQGFTCLTA